MTISYNPETVRGLAAACQTANDQLQRAQSLLEQIQSHGEWTCKEKSAIDDMMQDCRKQIGRLGENQLAFLLAVRQAENDLCGAEKLVSGLFEGVEELLGKILAIPVEQVITNGFGLLGQSGSGSTVERGHSRISHGGGGETVAEELPDWINDQWMHNHEDFEDWKGAIEVASFQDLNI